MKESRRYILLAAATAGSLIIVLFLDPIVQDPRYHDFADGRTIFGIPNFFNVISNIPFFFVGLFGFRISLKHVTQIIRPAWNICFAGVLAVSFGSAYYHLSPQDSTLVWDRLPMAVGFMGLFSALLGEYADEKIGAKVLLPALVVGLASIHYWQIFNDLRLYLWVQGIAILIIPLVALIFRYRYTHQYLIFISFLFYVAAKVFELKDLAFYEMTDGRMGGHALKHISAAMAIYVMLHMLKARRLKMN